MGYPIFHSQYTAAQIEASIGKTPRIKAATRTWEIWDISTSAYVDTGVSIDTELFVDSTLTEAGYAADAKVTGDKIGELKSALSSFLIDVNDTSFWEAGSISQRQGSNISAPNNDDLRTKGYINNAVDILRLKASGYKFALFAYNGDTYVGCWDGSSFITTSKSFFTNDVIIPNRSYNYRIVLEILSGTISTSNATNLGLLCETDATLTKSGYAADSAVVGGKLSEANTAINGMDTSIKALNESVFIYAFADKTCSVIGEKYQGYNASISGNNIAMGANANYDTYVYFAEDDTKVAVDPGSIAYYALSIGTNPNPVSVVTDGQGKFVYCQSAVRYRKSESNLPTTESPITISKNTALVVTVTKDTSPHILLWENSGIPKNSGNGAEVSVNVTSSQVEINGKNYHVKFTKHDETGDDAGRTQWLLTDLHGNGNNVILSTVDIIGVIQYASDQPGNNFMGGVHRREDIVTFRVLADGDDISGVAVCSEVHVIMDSHLYDVFTPANNVCDRFVEFVFTPEGWTCRVTFKPLVTATVNVAYCSGLFAFVGADCDGAYSNIGAVNLSSTSSRQLENADFKEITINMTDNLTINMSSETADVGWVTYRTGSAGNPASFKVYFANAQNQAVTNGSIITGKCTYRF